MITFLWLQIHTQPTPSYRPSQPVYSSSSPGSVQLREICMQMTLRGEFNDPLYLLWGKCPAVMIFCQQRKWTYEGRSALLGGRLLHNTYLPLSLPSICQAPTQSFTDVVTTTPSCNHTALFLHTTQSFSLAGLHSDVFYELQKGK